MLFALLVLCLAHAEPLPSAQDGYDQGEPVVIELGTREPLAGRPALFAYQLRQGEVWVERVRGRIQTRADQDGRATVELIGPPEAGTWRLRVVLLPGDEELFSEPFEVKGADVGTVEPTHTSFAMDQAITLAVDLREMHELITDGNCAARVACHLFREEQGVWTTIHADRIVQAACGLPTAMVQSTLELQCSQVITGMPEPGTWRVLLRDEHDTSWWSEPFEITDECPRPLGTWINQPLARAHYTEEGQPVQAVGTVLPLPGVSCDEGGPTCTAALTLDGDALLVGPEEGGALCGQSVGCTEEVDSCLPRWSCHPAQPGDRIMVRGRWSPREEGLPAVVVEGMEVVPPTPLSPLTGRFTGTLTTRQARGCDLGDLGRKLPVELVVALGGRGFVALLMSPTPISHHPLPAGWYEGRDGILVAGPASIELVRTTEGYEGTYTLEDGACQYRAEVDVSR